MPPPDSEAAMEGRGDLAPRERVDAMPIATSRPVDVRMSRPLDVSNLTGLHSRPKAHLYAKLGAGAEARFILQVGRSAAGPWDAADWCEDGPAVVFTGPCEEGRTVELGARSLTGHYTHVCIAAAVTGAGADAVTGASYLLRPSQMGALG